RMRDRGVEMAGPVGITSTVMRSDAIDAAGTATVVGAYVVFVALMPWPPYPGARFWMVLVGWRGRRGRRAIAARDAGELPARQIGFPAALIAPLAVLAVLAAMAFMGDDLARAGIEAGCWLALAGALALGLP